MWDPVVARSPPYDWQMIRLAAVLATASLALTGASPLRTALHVFTPWAGSIPARGVVIGKTLRGACSHGSEVLTRDDAWHCHVGSGRVYDPCFSNDRGEIGA